MAEYANMINEAAINAVKEGREYVCQKDLFEAVEQVLVGKEKKDRIMSAQERKIVSYHEVGHALIAALQKNSEPGINPKVVQSVMGHATYSTTIDIYTEVMGEMKESELAKFTLDVNTKDIINQN